MTTAADKATDYEGAARSMYPGCVAASEVVLLDHAYGKGMLTEFNKLS
ncbi:hypothetical protein [Azospirillum sp. B4]|nr:hypothetical protein [Azospirillum sp. B4]